GVLLGRDPPAHQLEAQEEEVGLDHVAPAVGVDVGEAPALPERLHAGAVHFALAREADQLRQQVETPRHAGGAEVGDELVEVVVRLVGGAVAEAALEVARHDAAVAEGRQLHHGEIEVASVEGDERPPEALDPLPELAHDARLAVAVGAEDLHAGQHALVVHVADDDRHRQVEGEREEVRAGAAARQEVGAGPLVGLLLADLLVAVQDRLDQRLVDARLDVEDREAHGGFLSPRCAAASTRSKRAASAGSVTSAATRSTAASPFARALARTKASAAGTRSTNVTRAPRRAAVKPGSPRPQPSSSTRRALRGTAAASTTAPLQRCAQ